MDWIEYKNKFINEARKNKKSNNYCEVHLQYAKKLWDNNVPIIYNQEHLCLLLGYSPYYVYAVSNSPSHFYRRFSIKKKNGNEREISEPLPSLKEIQTWILDNILINMEISSYAKAYIKGRSIKENARFHRRQKKVLTLDIENFFGNLSPWMVYRKFLDIGYKEEVAIILTNLCCLDGCLPQGAPTSALLSNIVLHDLDIVIAGYTFPKKIRFTRYADDMTFSGDFNEREVISFVRKQLKPYSLKINNAKTRVRCQGQQQEVTGIIVNQKMQISKRTRKNIRQAMYYIKKYGLESHLNYIDENHQNYLLHLLGIINFALFVNPNDKELREYQIILRKIQ